MSVDFGKPVDVRAALLRFFDSNGILYKEENGVFRMILSQNGRKWEVAFKADGEYFIICGAYPFIQSDPEAAYRLCSKINSELLDGSAFVSETCRAVIRTGAALDDEFFAQELIYRELEYNCAAINKFWNSFAQLSETLNPGIADP